MECDICGKTYSSLGNLTKHRTKVHGIETKKDCECGKHYDNAQASNAHYRHCIIHRNGKLPIPPWQKGKPSKHRGKKLEDIVGEEKALELKRQHSERSKGKIQGFAANPKLRWKRNHIPYIDSDGNWFLLESIHEWKVANILDKNGINWIRPKQIKLSSGYGYEPDFYLKDFNVYLDPKSKWKGKNGAKYLGFAGQEKQLEKIKQFEEEYHIICLILWHDDERSHTWNGILEQINGRLMERFT